MSDMKCLFCNEPLVITNKNLVSCQNLHCEIGNLPMPLIVVKETMRTKKQLEIAVDALKKIDMRCQNTVRNHLERATIRGELCDISFYARKAIDDIDNLEQITALEQKDVK